MVSSTETTVEIPRIYVVGADKVYLFCKATEDENKVHQGDNPVVPGFYLDFLVKNHFDARASARNPGMRFTGLDAKFRSVIHNDEPFFIKDEEIYNPRDGTLTYRMAVVKPQVPQPDGSLMDVEAVEGSVRYSLAQANPLSGRLNSKILPYSKRGKDYKLSAQLLDDVQRSLGFAEQDKIASVVSATSNALQTDKESFDVLFNEQLLGKKYPFFAKHDLTVYGGLDNLPVGAEFTVHNKHGDAKMGVHQAYVRGVNRTGTPIFDLTCTIMFHEQKAQ